MEIINCEQRSEEWYLARFGKVTASYFSYVLSKGAGRKTYMMKLVNERLTGELGSSYEDDNMRDGMQREAEALARYRATVAAPVTQVGFISLNDYVGGSPDGLVGETGIVEIKCPLSTTHRRYILRDKLPAPYKPQVQGLLWLSGRLWAHFVSDDDRVTEKPSWYKYVPRDEPYIQRLNAAVNIFVAELKKEIGNGRQERTNF